MRVDDGGTVRIAEHPRELSYQDFEVSVIDGPDRARRRRAEQRELNVGTAASSDLVLTDPTVSSHHCSITATTRGFLLRDLGSLNGTRVAGFRVESLFLQDGTEIAVGRSKLRFHPLDERIREPLSREDRFERLLGRSAVMRRIFALLPRLAASDSSVLLNGETGTGKGLLAEVIHERSRRVAGPFVVVDCTAIPEGLVESELFGHRKGAFTGADRDRQGAFVRARGGTVFLDEIGELPLHVQPKLLRALEERMVKPVGADEPERLDVRVLAATNRDLRAEVNQGRFRADLYYRLNVVHLSIPPLRERPEDIALLANSFHRQLHPSGAPAPAPMLERFATQPWPGNVRELRSAVERTVLGLDDVLAPGDLEAPPAVNGEPEPALDLSVAFRVAKEQVIASWERRYLRALLEHTKGNVSEAARLARMDRNYLRERLQRHHLTGTGRRQP